MDTFTTMFGGSNEQDATAKQVALRRKQVAELKRARAAAEAAAQVQPVSMPVHQFAPAPALAPASAPVPANIVRDAFARWFTPAPVKKVAASVAPPRVRARSKSAGRRPAPAKTLAFDSFEAARVHTIAVRSLSVLTFIGLVLLVAFGGVPEAYWKPLSPTKNHAVDFLVDAQSCALKQCELELNATSEKREQMFADRAIVGARYAVDRRSVTSTEMFLAHAWIALGLQPFSEGALLKEYRNYLADNSTTTSTRKYIGPTDDCPEVLPNEVPHDGCATLRVRDADAIQGAGEMRTLTDADWHRKLWANVKNLQTRSTLMTVLYTFALTLMGPLIVWPVLIYAVLARRLMTFGMYNGLSLSKDVFFTNMLHSRYLRIAVHLFSVARERDSTWFVLFGCDSDINGHVATMGLLMPALAGGVLTLLSFWEISDSILTLAVVLVSMILTGPARKVPASIKDVDIKIVTSHISAEKWDKILTLLDLAAFGVPAVIAGYNNRFVLFAFVLYVIVVQLVNYRIIPGDYMVVRRWGLTVEMLAKTVWLLVCSFVCTEDVFVFLSN